MRKRELEFMRQNYRYYKDRGKKRKIILSWLIILSCLTICIFALKETRILAPVKNSSPTLPTSSTDQIDHTDHDNNDLKINSKPLAPAEETETKEEVVNSPNENESADSLSEKKPSSDSTPIEEFENALPESAAVEDSYFDDAIFIGDSRTEGFALYSGLKNITAYTARGLTVSTIFTDKVIKTSGGKVTIMDAVRANSNFSKVYIMLGINELGWVYTDKFIEKYGEIIDTLRSINPDVIIYVQSVIPVTQKKSENDGIFNNKNIANYNALISKMAEDKEVYFVNVQQGLVDETGALPEEAAFDGIHLKVDYCKKWLAYLKTHTVKE